MTGGFRRALRPVRAPLAKSAPRQIWEMLNWGGRLVATPNDYRAHGLYVKGKTRRDAMRFLSVPRAKSLMWPLNPDHVHIEDKLLFESHFRSVGLPVPKTIGVFGNASVSTDVPVLCSPTHRCDFLVEKVSSGVQLAVKPVDRWGGVGVMVITAIDGEHFVLSNGDRRRVTRVIDETSDGTWLIQERIIQHPKLAELNDSSLNTLRLGTFRRNNGDVKIVFAKLRIGRAGSQLDSNSLGGLSVWIDPQSGAFANCAYQLAKFSLDPVFQHPDSKVLFEGRTFPQWNEVVSKASAFAKCAGENKFIGWDIAATEDGPLFVEGNHSWDVQLAQTGGQGMLTDEFVAMYNEDTGGRIDLSRAPPFRPFQALAGLRKAMS